MVPSTGSASNLRIGPGSVEMIHCPEQVMHEYPLLVLEVLTFAKWSLHGQMFFCTSECLGFEEAVLIFDGRLTACWGQTKFSEPGVQN